VLQCFITIPNFKKLLKKNNEISEILKQDIHVDLSDDNTFINHKHNPEKITGYFSKKFRLFQQHDAHEFLLDFLETLDIKEFYGKIKMNITCSCCKNVSSTFEEFTTINLPCNDEKDLVDIFIKYLEKEDIHDYHCEKCKKNILAEKKLYLFNLPLFLIIVLKTYTFNGKIHTDIKYPFENMKIRETESGKIFNYKLYSVVHHHGNSERGHYNCTVNVNNNWYFIDDDSIYIDANSKCKINNANSYILFYKKINE